MGSIQSEITVEYVKKRSHELADYLGLGPLSKPFDANISQKPICSNFDEKRKLVNLYKNASIAAVDHELTHLILWDAQLVVLGEDETTTLNSLRNKFYCYTLGELFAVMVEKRLHPELQNSSDLEFMIMNSNYLPYPSPRGLKKGETSEVFADDPNSYQEDLKWGGLNFTRIQKMNEYNIISDLTDGLPLPIDDYLSELLEDYFKGLPPDLIVFTGHNVGVASASLLIDLKKNPLELIQQFKHNSGNCSYERFYWSYIVPIFPKESIKRFALPECSLNPIA
jgi:hypothetical protein